MFKLKGFSRFWAVVKELHCSRLFRVVSPFDSRFSQTFLHQSEPPSKTSIANQFSCYFHPCREELCSSSLYTFCRLFVAMKLLSGLAYSSLDIKDISKMICFLKFIFAWILFTPQLTSNVFDRDFDRIL